VNTATKRPFRNEIRVLGIDDGPFDKYKKGNCLIVGTFYRGGNYLDGLLSVKVKVDGTNATAKIVSMINASKFKQHIRCIFLNGIAVAGFNIIDLHKLNNQTGIPVMVVIREYPNYEKIYSALDKMGKPERKMLIACISKPIKLNNIYVQYVGLSEEKAKSLLKITTTHAYVPECLRVAHLIAGGLTTGESKGSA
jgi:uncharacterized protein